MKIVVEIQMGNDEMKYSYQVADALRNAADMMEWHLFEGGRNGCSMLIRDNNGNTIGKVFSKESDE